MQEKRKKKILYLRFILRGYSRSKKYNLLSSYTSVDGNFTFLAFNFS